MTQPFQPWSYYAMNLVCIRHPHYDGLETPVLSCKTCCTIFLAELRYQQLGPEFPEAIGDDQVAPQGRDSVLSSVIKTL